MERKFFWKIRGVGGPNGSFSTLFFNCVTCKMCETLIPLLIFLYYTTYIIVSLSIKEKVDQNQDYPTLYFVLKYLVDLFIYIPKCLITILSVRIRRARFAL